MQATCKNQIDLSKKASQIVKTSYAEVETRKTLEQKRVREIQTQGEIAYLEVDQIKDTTAGFNDNKEIEEGEIVCPEINRIKDTTGFNDNKEAKKRERARLKEIQKQREIARLKLDQIENTAHLNDNVEAEREFYKLTHGRLLSEDEFDMLIYFEEPLDPFFYQ
ncbi:hypothetical protein K1719_013229 [Acacia pycnantha]|nr:hypothetical protein K1719_013229 [Acacia pycnantha]